MIAAACHIHSDWSYDGKWPLRALAAEFGQRGYRVLMITEHDRGFTRARQEQHRAECAHASTDKLFILPGIEYSDADNTVHVLVWGPVPFLGEGLPTAQLLKAVRLANGVAVMAHPARRDAWRVFDPAWAADLLGIEVWNRKMDGWAPSQSALSLAADTPLKFFVGMDFHARNQMFPLAMNLDITGAITEESILNCLRARDCQPMAFDQPLDRSLQGWRRAGLRAAEWARRKAAVSGRYLIRQAAAK